MIKTIMEENDIHIPMNEDNSESSKDIIRSEEPWRSKSEDYFIRIKNEILDKADRHNAKSHKNKKLYVYTSIPAVVIPLILSNLSIFSDEYQMFQPIGLTFVAIINSIQSLLNFSKKTEQHNLFSGKYAELAGEIDKILVRSKQHREAFDLCLERITNKKNYLDDSAPYL